MASSQESQGDNLDIPMDVMVNGITSGTSQQSLLQASTLLHSPTASTSSLAQQNSSASPNGHIWYFSERVGEPVTILTTTREYMFEHVIPESDVSEGYHNFNIYTGSEFFAMHEVIKNISFAFYQGDRCVLQLAVSETEIKRISKERINRLHLHPEVGIHPIADQEYKISIAIITQEYHPSEPRSLPLHYLELTPARASQQRMNDRVIYGIDTVPLSLCCWESDIPIKITAFSISETEEYIGILYIIDSNVYCRVHNLGLSKRGETNDTIRGMDDFYLFPLKDITTSTECPELRIAINRDGTQIALFRSLSDASLKTAPAPTEKLDFDLHIYSIVRKPKKISSIRISARIPLNTIGFGKFKTLLSDKEVFLHCDGHNLSMFIHRYRKWRMFRRIQLSPPIPTQSSPLPVMQTQQSINTLLFAKEVIESAQGSVFAWLGDPRAVSIWSIEFGFITSFVPAQNLPSAKDDNAVESFNQGRSSSRMMVRIAPHGRFMVIACGNQISKYLLPSATHVGRTDITNCFGSDCTILNISFLATGPKILVVLQDHVKKSRLIATLEVESQQWSGEVALPFDSEELYTGVFSRIYDIRGPTIDIYPIDFSMPTLRDHNRHSACTETVLNMDVIFGNQEYSPKVGENFQLMTRDLDVTTELVLTYNNGERIRNWNFPKREDHQPLQDISRANTGVLGGGSIPNITNSQAFFLEGYSRFVLVGAGYIQVWGLPEEDNGTCNLIAIVTEPKPTTGSDFQYGIPSLSVCPYMQHLTVTFGGFDSETIDMLADLPNGHIYQHKIESQSTLVQLYVAAKGNNEYRQAILRYFTEAFAQCSTWDDSKNMFLYSLCENWETEGFEDLLQHLVLGQHAFRWIPSFPKTDTNPIRLGIDKSRESPQRNIQFHKTIIKHCIRNATREGDTFFLKPILECMRLILEDRNLGLEVTRQLAFIPVLESSRNFIIENSITGHSLSLKISFINRGGRNALYKQDSPTLNLQNPQPPDPENKYFKDGLFMAPLDMLSEFHLRGRNDSKNILPEDYDNAWWTNNIECRGLLYPPTLLDNPALEALIQHEWNAAGSRLWLRRTFAHAVFFYLLIALQSIPGILGTVSTEEDLSNLSAIKDWSFPRTIFKVILIILLIFGIETNIVNAVLSTYPTKHSKIMLPSFLHGNIVMAILKILLFLTPACYVWGIIVDSVQVVTIINLLFHFSLLLKLRVNQGFCKFLDFLSRLIHEIGVFLALFAFVVLVFAHTFWYLLHGCLGYQCNNSTTNFPSNFFGAIFATYFFLGGQYDPVQDEMDGSLSMLHVVMALYYFFTAIVMVNVLIGVALGKSIEEGNSTWRLRLLLGRSKYVRMRLYQGRNTRQVRAKLVFGQETYYTATDQAVIAFKEKYMLDCEDFLRDRKIEDDSSVSDVGKDAQIEELKAQVADMNNKMEDMMTMMKQALQERRISEGSTS